MVLTYLEILCYHVIPLHSNFLFSFCILTLLLITLYILKYQFFLLIITLKSLFLPLYII